MRISPLALALLAGPALAQSAGTYEVPFASSGNAVELEVASSPVSTTGYVVAVTSAPTWLRFSTWMTEASVSEAADSEVSGLPVARLAFDVGREAPVGEPADVKFEVRLGSAVVGTHTVRLAVAAPTELALGTPYPNPSRSGAAVPFEVPEAGPVTVTVFDALGREVAVVFDGEAAPGAHEARVPADLTAGVYLVRLVAEGEALVRRLTVMR